MPLFSKDNSTMLKKSAPLDRSLLGASVLIELFSIHPKIKNDNICLSVVEIQQRSATIYGIRSEYFHIEF